MPIISQFYGIIIQIFFKEDGPHNQKHILIHKEELQSLWDLMQEQGEFFKIEPLK